MNDEPVLRPWRVSDAPTLLRHRRGAPDLARELPELGDVGAARRLIEGWIADDGWHHTIAINGVAMANVSVSHVDRRHSFGWVSYWIVPNLRGRGLMKRAVVSVADLALLDDPMPVFRLELGHRLDNPASGAVAEAAGFVPEGIERQKLCYDGRRYDTRTMSRLRTDPRPTLEGLPFER